MKLNKEDHVKVVTDYGSITVNWEPEKGLAHGSVFFPYGPWANQVYASSTHSTGMPIMKGIPATIEPCIEKVPTLEEIVENLRSGS